MEKDRLFTERETANMLGVSEKTLQAWRSRASWTSWGVRSNRYPLRWVRLGDRAIRYRESDVLDFISYGLEQAKGGQK